MPKSFRRVHNVDSMNQHKLVSRSIKGKLRKVSYDDRCTDKLMRHDVYR